MFPIHCLYMGYRKPSSSYHLFKMVVHCVPRTSSTAHMHYTYRLQMLRLSVTSIYSCRILQSFSNSDWSLAFYCWQPLCYCRLVPIIAQKSAHSLSKHLSTEYELWYTYSLENITITWKVVSFYQVVAHSLNLYLFPLCTIISLPKAALRRDWTLRALELLKSLGNNGDVPCKKVHVAFHSSVPAFRFQSSISRQVPGFVDILYDIKRCWNYSNLTINPILASYLLF